MDRLKVLGTTYAIERVPSISRDEFVVGQIDYAAQKVLLLDGLAPECERVTLLHEMMHGILNALGRNMENMDETLVQSLATALHQCLCDNPALFGG